MNIEQISALIISIGAVGGIAYWALYQRMVSDMDNRYMSLEDCNNKHKVTDTMFAALRDDIKEIKNSLDKIHDVIFDAISQVHKNNGR